MSISKLLVSERAEDYGTKDGITIKSIIDELIEKSSNIYTSMCLLSKKNHNGHFIQTKVIFGTISNFDHFIEISRPNPMHGRSIVRGFPSAADITV